MFKKTLLALTAFSIISLLPHTVITPADAAVKVKPATVDIKAKIRPNIRSEAGKNQMRAPAPEDTAPTRRNSAGPSGYPEAPNG